MSNLFTRALLATTFLAPVSVIAADLPVKVPSIAPAPVLSQASGAYLRGDVGGTFWAEPAAKYGAALVFFNNEIDPTVLLGVGLGYRFTDFFRADLTVDYRFDADFYGQGPCTCPSPGYSREYSSVSVWTALANVYLDMATFENFTPYVGVGAGVAGIKFDNIRGFNPDGSTTNIAGDSSITYAAAAMLGLTYDINEKLAVDANYRFLAMGDGHSAKDVINQKVKYSDLYGHEVRLGLRYNLY